MLERTEKSLRTRNGVQKKLVSVEVPLDIFKRLREQAEKETRTISRQVIHILKSALTQDEHR